MKSKIFPKLKQLKITFAYQTLEYLGFKSYGCAVLTIYFYKEYKEEKGWGRDLSLLPDR